MKYDKIMPAHTDALSRLFISPTGKEVDLREIQEYDTSYSIPGIARFRVNIYRQRGSLAIVLRIIPFGIPKFEELGLPPVVQKIAGHKHLSTTMRYCGNLAAEQKAAAPAGDVLGQLSARADSSGQLSYTVPIETGRYGTVVVFATGSDSLGDPFALQTTGELVACPPDLARTGNSGSGTFLQIAFE